MGVLSSTKYSDIHTTGTLSGAPPRVQTPVPWLCLLLVSCLSRPLTCDTACLAARPMFQRVNAQHWASDGSSQSHLAWSTLSLRTGSGARLTPRNLLRVLPSVLIAFNPALPDVLPAFFRWAP